MVSCGFCVIVGVLVADFGGFAVFVFVFLFDSVWFCYSDFVVWCVVMAWL